MTTLAPRLLTWLRVGVMAVELVGSVISALGLLAAAACSSGICACGVKVESSATLVRSKPAALAPCTIPHWNEIWYEFADAGLTKASVGVLVDVLPLLPLLLE